MIWFTGLSGSGKTTLARGVCENLRARGLRVELLDGDELRKAFPGTGFGRAEREAHVTRAGGMAARLQKDGAVVVASLISPYAASRKVARELCRNFIEVHVSTPLEICERRDPKGLYAKARRGELADFTGVQDPYEAPASCELTVDSGALPPEAALARVLDYLKTRNLPR